jgi:2-polyprenyl-3-methyl-5-hydroxy-6-metoxy-1,4-benzoquinol methylase
MQTAERFSATACLLCGGTDRALLATRGRGFVPLRTAICTGCGLVSHDPLPEPETLAAFYAERYRRDYKGGERPKPKHVLRALRGAVARAARLASHLPERARVLDVGASSGEFVHVMRRLGHEASGIEPNRGYAAAARERWGVALAAGGIEEARIAPASLDVVTLNHVLEHVRDPVATLAACRASLRPGGVLFVEVPNLAGMRKQAANTFHRAHIWNFTPATLHGVALRAGFVPLPGEAADSTSLLLCPARPATPAADPAEALRLMRQVRQEQGALAYLLSGAPFTRRWHRLRRNIDEAWLLRTAPLEALAERLIAEARIPRGQAAPRRAA